MSSPLTDATSTPASTTLRELTPRERVERVLAALPNAEEAQGLTQTVGAPGHQELVAPVQRINEVMRPYGVQFELWEFDSQVVTRIVDRESGEMIRQIPAEEVLRVAQRLEAMQGRLLDLEA